MYINEDVLKYFLNYGFEGLEKDKKDIDKRFKRIDEIFANTSRYINYDKCILEKIKDSSNLPKELQNINIDEGLKIGYARAFTQPKGFYGIVKQADALCQVEKEEKSQGELKEFIKDLLSIMGGFEFSKNDYSRMVDGYRLLNNNSTNYDFVGKTKTGGQFQWISSHFADNTIFIEFCKFIQGSKNKFSLADIQQIKRNNIALCYIDRIGGGYKEQQKILNYRFPYKFMWMWANADKVIHPISLDAFRNFLNSDFMQDIFKELSADDDFKNLNYAWSDEKKYNFGDQGRQKTDLKEYSWVITDCHFDSFPVIWKKVSEKVSEKLKCDDFEKLSKVISFLCIGETDMKNISDLLKTHKQIILYGVPGTGKTYSAKKVVYDWIDDKPKTDNDDIKEFVKEYRFKKEDEKPSGNIVWDIVQFHPNYSYQDFIGGIAPKVNDGSLSYKLNDGIFKKFCDCAKKYTKKKFIFIIDEINRANLSEVFGELLYALEYRDESVSVANFNEFCIPSNVYIIGTMNNVDKSLVTFDLALRRRFGFYEVGVDYGVIYKTFKEDEQPDNIDNYVQRCIELNYFLSGDEDLSGYEDSKIKELEAIKLENTQDYYKIGHAYFMKIKSFMRDDEASINPNHLEKLWIYHIEPLLMEYLGLSYDDSNVKKSINEIKKHFVKKLDEE